MVYGYGNYYSPYASTAYQPAVYPQPQPVQQNVPYVPQPAEAQGKMPPISGVAWVDGITSGKAQNIPYGTSYLLLDSKEPYFYIKTVGYDGKPQPLFIAKYKQIQEEDLTAPQEPAKEPEPQVDLSDYIRKEDLDKRLSELGRFVTDEELDDRVLRVIQEKMMPSKSVKRGTKATEKGEEPNDASV